uniref:Uncharacterized protein n=1 Tax=Cacopsylla melanoneura TaxID=428564 RepID=A0A8D8W5J4_9HEMI
MQRMDSGSSTLRRIHWMSSTSSTEHTTILMHAVLTSHAWSQCYEMTSDTSRITRESTGSVEADLVPYCSFLPRLEFNLTLTTGVTPGRPCSCSGTKYQT